jgi:hypothetical protein
VRLNGCVLCVTLHDRPQRASCGVSSLRQAKQPSGLPRCVASAAAATSAFGRRLLPHFKLLSLAAPVLPIRIGLGRSQRVSATPCPLHLTQGFGSSTTSRNSFLAPCRAVGQMFAFVARSSTAATWPHLKISGNEIIRTFASANINFGGSGTY